MYRSEMDRRIDEFILVTTRVRVSKRNYYYTTTTNAHTRLLSAHPPLATLALSTVAVTSVSFTGNHRRSRIRVSQTIAYQQTGKTIRKAAAENATETTGLSRQSVTG